MHVIIVMPMDAAAAAVMRGPQMGTMHGRSISQRARSVAPTRRRGRARAYDYFFLVEGALYLLVQL